MSQHFRTSLGLTGSVYLEHPVSGLRMERFDRVVEALRSCDVTMANLEGCIHDGSDWPSFTAGAVGSGTYMGGPPSMVEELKHLGFDALFAGSNHVSDFGENGILTTIRHLVDREMPFAGIGASLTEASAPCYVDTAHGRRVAIISACDWGPRGAMDMLFPWPHGYLPSDEMPPFRSRPGVNLLRYDAATRVERQTLDELRRASAYLDWDTPKALRRTGMMRDYPVIYGERPDCEVDTEDEFYFMGRKFVASDEPGSDTFAFREDLERILKFVKEARRQADIVVFALHDQSLRQGGVHDYVKETAYSVLDAGADVVVNTGGLQRGVEIRDGKTILWGLGSILLQNNQITRLPSSSYAYWGLPADSTVADLLEVRNERAKATENSPIDRPLYPLLPPSLHELHFDDANRLRRVRIQPFALDAEAPSFRSELPLWPSAAEADSEVERAIALSAEFGSALRAEDGAAVLDIA